MHRQVSEVFLTIYFPLETISNQNFIYLCSITQTCAKTMECICNVKDIFKTLYQFEKDFADAHNITINEAMLLCCLKDSDCKTAGTLCEYIGLSNSRVSKVITSVENKGYIDRSLCKEDKRQMLFSLTDKGKEKVDQMMSAQLNFDKLLQDLRTLIPE